MSYYIIPIGKSCVTNNNTIYVRFVRCVKYRLRQHVKQIPNMSIITLYQYIHMYYIGIYIYNYKLRTSIVCFVKNTYNNLSV